MVGVAENTNFADVVAMSYSTQLVSTILEFTIAGGKCGIRNNANSEFVESFICELPWTSVAMNKLLTVPRRFVQRSINTEEYWQLLSDVSGLIFKDLDMTDSETSASDEGSGKVQHDEDGVMFDVYTVS